MAHAWAALLLAACASARMRGAPRDPARERAAALARAEVQTIDERLAYWTAPTGGQRPNSSTYLTFELDSGGWNNVRMGVETMLAIAHVTRRTLVLPPRERVYLLREPVDLRRWLRFAWPSVEVIDMAEFLRREGHRLGCAPPAEAAPALWAALRAAGRDPGWIPTRHCLVASETPDPIALAAFCGGRTPADGDAPGPAPRPLANCTPPSRVRSFPTPPPFVGYDYSGDECSCAYARGLSLCPAKKTGRSQDRARHAAAPCAR
ncbi:hypothetical protein JL721_918 [Aureococcus anophagefferens]|nr:hypothetical protein JL721_918 [Aureococcus anophagefferens]